MVELVEPSVAVYGRRWDVSDELTSSQIAEQAMTQMGLLSVKGNKGSEETTLVLATAKLIEYPMRVWRYCENLGTVSDQDDVGACRELDQGRRNEGFFSNIRNAMGTA